MHSTLTQSVLTFWNEFVELLWSTNHSRTQRKQNTPMHLETIYLKIKFAEKLSKFRNCKNFERYKKISGEEWIKIVTIFIIPTKKN